jgi:hypothetical protein
MWGTVVCLVVAPPHAAHAEQKPVPADELIWQGIKDQTGAGVFEMFLSLYPGSQHAAEAKLRIKEITAVAGETWRGFKSLKSAPLPAKIDKGLLRRTVFQIETYGSAAEKAEIVDIAKAGRNPLKGKRYGTPAFSRAVQLASCIRQKIRNCPVLEQVVGTAFAVDNGSTMVTARHVMSAWALAAVKANPGLKFGDVVQPFLLFNPQRKLIYNSASAKQRPKLAFWNRNPIPDQFVDNEDTPQNRLYSQSDYLEFSFDKPVFERALKRSDVDIENAVSSVYALGYPYLEGFYEINEKEDFAGKLPRSYSLTVSGGRYQGRFHALYAMNAYAFNGMSGGPVLDSHGDVLGVFVSVLDARFAKRGVFERSFFVRSDKKLLAETWALPMWQGAVSQQQED